MAKTKVLLIGWDAADWQVIDPLIKAGKMPALKRLLLNGSKANLATLSPALSPMLWTSIATGKRAYDHGIHGFVQLDKVNGDVKPVEATSRKVKTFWNILNEAGYKTNVVNWWPSHPVEKLNGTMVSNQFHKDAPVYGDDWPIDKACVYPSSLLKELENLRVHPAELGLEHVVPFIPQAQSLNPETDKVLKPLMRVLAHCASVHNAATYLMEHTEWDCMAVYYEAIDHFSHLAMKYHPPQLEGVSDEDYQLYKKVVEGAYRYHDMMLDRMMDLAGDDCNIILLSDHGFQSSELREIELPDVAAAPALEHREYGVFAACGPMVKKKEQLYGASLLDVCPSLLHLFDLPIGEDMEGKVLRDLFTQEREISEIPSWERTTVKPQFIGESSTHSVQMLSQLEELGYIDLSGKEKVKHVESELKYNLIVSLLDGGKNEAAAEESSKAYHLEKEFRFALLWSRALIKMGNLMQLEKLLDELEIDNPGQPSLAYFRGLMELGYGRVAEAIKSFKFLEQRGVVSTSLWIEIGRSLMISSQLLEAKNYFDKVLSVDPENAAALTSKAQCLLELEGNESALKLIDYSLSLQFYQPQAHYLMALICANMKKGGMAVKALEICLHQAPKHKGARALLVKLQESKAENNQPIIVVSGFPRSGTSMAMSILQQGGLELFDDNVRKNDESNPEGYFEHELIKGLAVDNKWVKNVRGKVMKVVSPLLKYLPQDEVYKVIVIKRPLTEVILSQEVMRGRKKEEVMRNFPFQLAMELQQEEKMLADWIQRQPNIESLVIEYYDCIENTEKVVEELNSFLNINMSLEKAKNAINPKLHRNKLAK